MITFIKNDGESKSFQETICLPQRTNLFSKNTAIDGSNYSEFFGYQRSFYVEIKEISEKEKNFLESIVEPFRFVSDNNVKMNGLIFSNITIDKKFKFLNETYYNVNFTIEEVVV